MTVQTLLGKQIVIAVTGSIAAVETVKLIHALRRKGAAVQPVMSSAAQGIIHPDALTYASGNMTLTRISGMVEHVLFCGDGGSADLLLIAPCTANTIGKIACGIDDTPVTTFATTALGSRMPVLVVPAMHHSMYRHPAVAENIAKLQQWGVLFAGPKIEEGKAKIADTDEIVMWCERAVSGMPLAGKRVLITSGACRETVDDVRVLTTRSSGRMGQALATQAFRLGADVTIVHHDIMPGVTNIRVETAEEMRDAVHAVFKKSGADIYISAAAISDFAPERAAGKIPSGAPVTLRLIPLPKLLDEVCQQYRAIFVAFKIGEDTEKPAQEMLGKGIAMVITNTKESMGGPDGAYHILTTHNDRHVSGTKEEIAIAVWEDLISNLRKSHQG
ncbi:MAG: bifunctional phosphopantothenoylcysteine decarboxylase/phosphopantothenate--cysteine ligase CoaBC [Methanoregula sp.]